MKPRRPHQPVVEASLPEPDEDVRRLAAFSDAVFAIAMTLLVLDLDKPDPNQITSSAALRHELAQWNAYGAFALSFAVIGLYWRAHFSAFRYLLRVDGPLLWLNLLMLLGVTFLPFPTAVLEDFSDERIAVILYAGTLAAIGFVWAALWLYADRRRLLSVPEVRLNNAVVRRILIAPSVFGISIGIAAADPAWAVRSWILIFVLFVLNRLIWGRKAIERRGERSDA